MNDPQWLNVALYEFLQHGRKMAFHLCAAWLRIPRKLRSGEIAVGVNKNGIKRQLSLE